MAKKRISVIDRLAQLQANGDLPVKEGEERDTSPAPVTTLGEVRSDGKPRKGKARVDPARVRLWKLADRPENETGHSADIAASFKSEGQLAPAIVRPVDDVEGIDYEVIAGHVRWRAAKTAGTQLDVVIREVSDAEAFRIMAAENDKRRNLSDYALAQRYQRALDSGIYKSKTELAKDMDLTASQLSYFLAFASLPDSIVSQIKDIRKVSYRLGYELSKACAQGKEEAVLRALDKIESGDNQKSIVDAIYSEENPEVTAPTVAETEKASRPSRNSDTSTQKFKSRTGQHLFSLRTYQGKGPSFSFPQSLEPIVDEKFIDEFKELVERSLARLGEDEQ